MIKGNRSLVKVESRWEAGGVVTLLSTKFSSGSGVVPQTELQVWTWIWFSTSNRKYFANAQDILRREF